MASLSSKQKRRHRSAAFWAFDSIEIGSGNHILRLAAIIIISVDLGLVGPQAVSTEERRDAFIIETKKKAAPEDAAFMVLILLGFKFPRSGLVQPAIIVISGGSRNFDADFIKLITKKLPIADFLQKPVAFDALGGAIEKALSARDGK